MQPLPPVDFLLTDQDLKLPPLACDEEPQAVICKIESLFFAFANDLIHGRADGAISMVRRTSTNVVEDPISGAISLGDIITLRKFNLRNAAKVAQLFQVLHVAHSLLRQGRRMSQREMYYLLVESFSSQRRLNEIILDASAVLRVPRYALNIGAATRGVLAGCLHLALAESSYRVDCEFVGIVRFNAKPLMHSLYHLTNTWLARLPFPGPVLTEWVANSRRCKSSKLYHCALQCTLYFR